MHRTPPMTKNYMTQAINRAEVSKSWFKGIHQVQLKQILHDSLFQYSIFSVVKLLSLDLSF